jgi:hypothetical protein
LNRRLLIGRWPRTWRDRPRSDWHGRLRADRNLHRWLSWQRLRQHRPIAKDQLARWRCLPLEINLKRRWNGCESRHRDRLHIPPPLSTYDFEGRSDLENAVAGSRFEPATLGSSAPIQA